ncbi:MAG: type II secretion system protein GspN [Deltaproteobacteria bacterium]|nr:type II secretion system protein GspN [Deltaproteobacteria bacterium]MBW2071653.1 type II secretion system protein GspN [Deltaproteobacteria bacterium]
MTRRPLVYLLYIVVLAAVLVLWKFPYARLEPGIEQLLSRHLGVAVDLHDISLGFPLVLKAGRCTVWQEGSRPQLLWETTGVSLRPHLLPLFRGRLEVGFRGRAYEGTLEGRLNVGPVYAPDNYRLSLAWTDIMLEPNQALTSLFGRQLSGKLTGQLHLEGAPGDWLNSRGSTEVALQEGTCSVVFPYLVTDTLRGLEIRAEATVHDRKLQISRCVFRADGLRGSLQGTVKLRQDLRRSRMDLRGQAQVDAALINLATTTGNAARALFQRGKSIPFHLRGTLKRPRVQIF